MADVFRFVDPRFGRVELEGEGPWQVHELGRGSYTIVDKNLRPARPTIWRSLPGGGGGGSKPDANVVWVSKSTPNVIAAAANV